MARTLGHLQYGKAEVRVVRVYRDRDPHEIVDHTVSLTVAGDIAASYETGDNSACLTTDTMKNTVNAMARERGEVARTPESFALALATHLRETVASVRQARVTVDTRPWVRLAAGGSPSPHAFALDGGRVDTASAVAGEQALTLVSGVRELVLLKTTDSEYGGFLRDRFTTLAPTDDRVLATSVTGQWAHTDPSGQHDWADERAKALGALTGAFAAHHSKALQQTLVVMGEAVLDAVPTVAEVRLSLPNRHHFLVDLSPFGLDNPGEVFHADDRPYGLIEGTVRRAGAAEQPGAFDAGQGW